MSRLRAVCPNTCSPPFAQLVLEGTFPVIQDTSKTTNLRQPHRGPGSLTQSTGRAPIAGQRLMTGETRCIPRQDLARFALGGRTMEQNRKIIGVQVTARAPMSRVRSKSNLGARASCWSSRGLGGRASRISLLWPQRKRRSPSKRSTTLDPPDLTQFASHEPIRTNGERQTSVSKRRQES